MKVDLVYPGSVSGSENYSSEPPLGPVALYSSLSSRWKRNTRFLDSTLLSPIEIEEAIRERRPDIVALSTTSFNYSRTIELAQIAKEVAAVVIVGGIHVTFMRDRILDKMKKGERAFDFLIEGQGEASFLSLLNALEQSSAYDSIPNLSYIQDGSLRINPSLHHRYGTDPLKHALDFSQINFERYSERFRRYGNLSSVRIAGSMFTQRGCAYAGKGKCVFCSIEEINPRRPTELIYQDVCTLIRDHHVDHIRINDGDFTINKRHMNLVADAIRNAFEATGREPTFYCFARADELDEERVNTLKRMNVVAVFIGYESGSDTMLRSMHKFTTKTENLQAARLLRDNGIDVVCAGMVLGAEGETEETLQETLDFAYELKAIGNTQALVATPLIPLPGSPSFGKLLQVLQERDRRKYKDFASADNFVIEELVELWNQHMTEVPLSRLHATSDQIAESFQIGIRFLRFEKSGTASESTKPATVWACTPGVKNRLEPSRSN